MLPSYIAKAVPNPPSNRAPWYQNTAPTYAGIFLWVAFYQALAGQALPYAGLGVAIAALAVAGLLSYGLYYYAPAMLGMKTGFPLYVVGSSTFGTKGGYIMPGLLMGALQIGWFAVGTALAARFILQAAGIEPKVGSALFIGICIVWGYVMALIGAAGIQYVSKVALYLNAISFIAVLVIFVKMMPGLSSYTAPANSNPIQAFSALLAAVIGFFATAGAAGADFGMNSRDAGDVRKGGLVGIALAILYAGGLPILSVAGARGLNPNLGSYDYNAVIAMLGGSAASIMFIVFAIASIPSACFCAFIAGNSFSTMIPGVKRISSMMVAVTVAIILAATGIADNLIGFFSLVGASFGPICGAMAADYWLSGLKWAGPREGINWAGYLAWAVGFAVGVWGPQPAVVLSFVVGFFVYFIAAKAGLQTSVVPTPQTATARA